MRRHWTAWVLLVLPVMALVLASPLAGAQERSERVEDGLAETALTEVVLVEETMAEEPPDGEEEAAEPAASLEAMRAMTVAGVAAEDQDAARYALFRGLLSAGKDGDFEGGEPVSRGETIQALYRLSGILVRADGLRYEDVPEAYQDAVAWAVSCGVSGGLTEERFGTYSPVTRSQLAAMLYRFAAWRGEDMACGTAVMTEGEEVPAYAQEAVNWVLDRGLYEGMDSYGLYPSLPVSRLQLAEILARLQRERDPLAAALALRPGGAVSLSRQNHETLNESISAIARRHGAVGVQVAVIENGVVTDAYHYGWAVKGTTPMTDQHKLRVASLSKVAVGISAALLREDEVIDYDADIGDYWGKNARNPRHPDVPVTIRSMLTHTSTLLNSESIAWDYAGVKAQLGSPSGYGSGTPGSLKNWSYNNHAFGILGQTLELASGQFLDNLLEERLLGPMGADCAFASGELKRPELITPLYRVSSLGRTAESLRSIRRWSAPGATGRYFAGGFTSSATDMAKLVALLAGGGCFEGVQLMNAGSVALMESHSAQVLPDGSCQAMPMRYRTGIYGRKALYYHTGSAYGVYNLLSYDPSTGDGVVVLTMGADGGTDAYGIYAVCGEISKTVYEAIK